MTKLTPPKNISRKHRKLYDALPAGTQQVYATGKCANCYIELVRKDLEWSIEHQFLPVCETDRKETQERLDKLWGHLAQIKLL